MSLVNTLVYPLRENLLTLNDNECEVIVFGRGVGESILVRTPQDNWFAVDSCLDPETGRSVSLEYLTAIEVNPEKVKTIIVSHWHDDHVKGMADLVESCPNASIVISEVMTTEELLTLVQLQRSHKIILDKVPTGLDEMGRVLEHLQEKGSFPVFATVNKLVFEINDQKIWTLSPSDKESLKAKQAIAKLIPKSNSPKKRLPLLEPNHCAVVTYFEVGDITFIMGSDLENSSDIECGWGGLLKNGLPLKNKKSAFLKIAHHGSSNAHHDELWEKHLAQDASASITPYNRSHLPKNEDIERIGKLSQKCHLSGRISRKKDLPRRLNAVDKMLNSATLSRKALESGLGIVRIVLDCSTGAEKSVNYFGHAGLLKDMVS